MWGERRSARRLNALIFEDRGDLVQVVRVAPATPWKRVYYVLPRTLLIMHPGLSKRRILLALCQGSLTFFVHDRLIRKEHGLTSEENQLLTIHRP